MARAPAGSPCCRSGRAIPSANSESPLSSARVADQQAGHVGGVAGEGQSADGDVTDADRVAVVQRGEGVRDAALERRRRQAQARSGLRGQGTGAGEVVGVQVRVDDIGDRRAELGRERAVELGVRRGVDDERLAAGRDHVGQAAASGPLDLEHGEPVDAEVDRSRLQGADPAAHAALDEHRVDALGAQRLRDALRGEAAVAHHGDRAVKAARRGASGRRAPPWRAGGASRAGRLDPPRRIVADIQHGQRRALRQALGEVCGGDRGCGW